MDAWTLWTSTLGVTEAMISDEKRTQIIELVEAGCSIRKAAKEVGVSKSLVWKIKKELESKGQGPRLAPSSVDVFPKAAKLGKSSPPGGVGKAQFGEADYPPKFRKRIAELRAQKAVEELQLELDEIREKRERILLDDPLLILAKFFRDLDSLPGEFLPDTAHIMEEALNNGWRNLLEAAKKAKRNVLYQALIKSLVVGLGISIDEFVKEGWFSDYGISLTDLKQNGVIH